jgi:hypothetical protein
MNNAQKAILIGAIIGVLLVPFVPYLLEPSRWNTAMFLEEAIEIISVASILIFVFRRKTGETSGSEIQPLTKKRKLLVGVLLALVMPVFGPGHGLTFLLQCSHLAYAAATDNLGYFGLPYILGGLVVYYLVSAFVLFLALSSVVWIKSSMMKNDHSLEMSNQSSEEKT